MHRGSGHVPLVVPDHPLRSASERYRREQPKRSRSGTSRLKPTAVASENVVFLYLSLRPKIDPNTRASFFDHFVSTDT